MNEFLYDRIPITILVRCMRNMRIQNRALIQYEIRLWDYRDEINIFICIALSNMGIIIWNVFGVVSEFVIAKEIRRIWSFGNERAYIEFDRITSFKFHRC